MKSALEAVITSMARQIRRSNDHCHRNTCDGDKRPSSKTSPFKPLSQTLRTREGREGDRYRRERRRVRVPQFVRKIEPDTTETTSSHKT